MAIISKRTRWWSVVRERQRFGKEGSVLTYTVFRKGVENNSILFQFWNCWVLKKCCGIKDRLKYDDEFKCYACPTQKTDTKEENFCYCSWRECSRQCYSKNKEWMKRVEGATTFVKQRRFPPWSRKNIFCLCM